MFSCTSKSRSCTSPSKSFLEKELPTLILIHKTKVMDKCLWIGGTQSNFIIAQAAPCIIHNYQALLVLQEFTKLPTKLSLSNLFHFFFFSFSLGDMTQIIFHVEDELVDEIFSIMGYLSDRLHPQLDSFIVHAFWIRTLQEEGASISAHFAAASPGLLLLPIEKLLMQPSCSISLGRT